MENEPQPNKPKTYAEHRGLTEERGEQMRKIVNDTFDEVFNEDNEGVISEVELEDLITERVSPQNMTELRVMDRFMYFRFFSRFMDDEDCIVENEE